MMLILTWVIKYQSMYICLAYNLKYNVVVIVLETSVKFETSPVCCNVVMAKLYNARLCVESCQSQVCTCLGWQPCCTFC